MGERKVLVMVFGFLVWISEGRVVIFIKEESIDRGVDLWRG